MKIKDSAAHFILAFLPVVIGVPQIFSFMERPLSFLLLVVLLLLVSNLAFWYEWKQAVDKNVEKIYGSWKNFQKDSLDDVRMDILGMMSGFFAGFIVYVILRLL